LVNAHAEAPPLVTYFDHNASSPLLPCARAAWLEAEDQFPGNPSSPHRIGARADHALERARQRLAALLGCAPPDLVFTSGATESCNAVLQHFAAVAGVAAPVLIGAIEHPAVLAGAQHYFGPRVRLIPVKDQGVVELDWIRAHLHRERPAMVAVMAANNETGVLQPWQDVHALCAAAGVPFFCDATQWCGRLPGAGIGRCDFVAGSAHKFGGPRGVGFLQCSSSVFRPLLHGGRQQDGRRAGTENLPGVLAMLAALEWCEQQMLGGGIEQRLARRQRFEHDLQAALPGVSINGAVVERLWNTVSVVMPDADCRHRWVVKLDKAGFAVSTGSACSSGSESPSHVLTAMGLAAEAAGRALRFSANWLTPPAAWDALLSSLVNIQRAMATDVVARDAG
jgi:cysteine desulfurase